MIIVGAGYAEATAKKQTLSSLAIVSVKSSTTGKAGGLKDPEPLEAVENLEPPKGDYC